MGGCGGVLVWGVVLVLVFVVLVWVVVWKEGEVACSPLSRHWHCCRRFHRRQEEEMREGEREEREEREREEREEREDQAEAQCRRWQEGEETWRMCLLRSVRLKRRSGGL